MLRFNARGPDGLLNGNAPGQPSKLNDAQRQSIARMIENGPIPAIHSVVRWRLIDLAQWIFEEFRITIAKQTLSRELRAMPTPSSWSIKPDGTCRRDWSFPPTSPFSPCRRNAPSSTGRERLATHQGTKQPVAPRGVSLALKHNSTVDVSME